MIGLCLAYQRIALSAEQLLHHRHSARGVRHIKRRARISGRNLHRCVRTRCGGPANQKRQRHASALHFAGDEHHFIQRRRDEARQTNRIGANLFGARQNLIARDHDAEIVDLVAVTLQHDADNIFADIVHVAFDRRHDDLAVRFAGHAGALLFLFHVRNEVRHRLLHHPRGLHHLRQEHLAGAEEIADDRHAVHQRPLDHVQRPLSRQARFFRVFNDELVDAVHQRMRKPLVHWLFTPSQVLGCIALLAAALHPLGVFEQTLRSIIAAIEQHVLDTLAQFGLDIIVKRQRTGIDDAHVHAGADGVIEENRVHRLAHRFVAAERKRDVGDAARNVRAFELGADVDRRFEECLGVVGVLFDAGRDREDIRIEDDVFRRKASIDQCVVRARTNLDLALGGIGLPLLVKRHHHGRGPKAAHALGMFEKLRLAFLQRNRVHDRLALRAL